MSKKAAAEFMAKAAENPTLKEKVRSEGESLSDERFAHAVEVAKEDGFDFTVEELRSVMSSAQGAADGELMEEELEAVVGGVMSGYKYWLGKAMSLLNGSGGADSGGGGGGGVRG